MPFHTLWRMLGEGTYAVALEPTTDRDAGRFDAKERDELLWLEPGASRSYRLEVGVLNGATEIASFEDRINAAAMAASAPDRSASCGPPGCSHRWATRKGKWILKPGEFATESDSQSRRSAQRSNVGLPSKVSALT
jgi:hypothetical protein